MVGMLIGVTPKWALGSGPGSVSTPLVHSDPAVRTLARDRRGGGDDTDDEEGDDGNDPHRRKKHRQDEYAIGRLVRQETMGQELTVEVLCRQLQPMPLLMQWQLHLFPS